MFNLLLPLPQQSWSEVNAEGRTHTAARVGFQDGGNQSSLEPLEGSLVLLFNVVLNSDIACCRRVWLRDLIVVQPFTLLLLLLPAAL